MSRAPEGERPQGRMIDVGLDLLDKLILDKDGVMSGIVDDVELAWSDDDAPPYVSALLSGPQALAGRFRGRFGKLIARIHRRLDDRPDPQPVPISFGVVKKITNHIELSISKEDLDVSRLRDWSLETVISKIPGAEHAPE